ncbi:MAG TPA: Hsp20/alpha crystallin family protein [Burkholderiales bacterium]|nr:Hsp20/alpha crystallin family protein [Burkholderiales bacterium]
MNERDPTSWMWAQALELLEEANRLQRQFFRPGQARATRPVWEPPADVFETERELFIVVALPGVPPERVEVVLDGRTLIVIGERPMPAECHAATLQQLEIPYGRFERRIALPPGALELGRRELVNGCVVLSLRKTS